MATAIRTLDTYLTWSDPAKLIDDDAGPYSIGFRHAIWSKDENGVWQLRHDTGNAIFEYSDAGGTGWQESVGVEYEDSDPNAEYYCRMKFLDTRVIYDNVEYDIDHDDKVLMVVCNSSDDAAQV